MHASRFDGLTRALTARCSRRRLLVATTGGAVGAFDSGVNPDAALAKRWPPCRKKNKRGKGRQKRPNGAPCGEGKTCQQGNCATCLVDFEPCTQTPVDRCCSGHCAPVQPGVFLCVPAQ